jgi:hypothetical protein
MQAKAIDDKVVSKDRNQRRRVCNLSCLKYQKKSRHKLSFPPKRAKIMLMEELVLRLYEQGIITSAHGASLLKKDRVSFERFLA